MKRLLVLGALLVSVQAYAFCSGYGANRILRERFSLTDDQAMTVASSVPAFEQAVRRICDDGCRFGGEACHRRYAAEVETHAQALSNVVAGLPVREQCGWLGQPSILETTCGAGPTRICSGTLYCSGDGQITIGGQKYDTSDVNFAQVGCSEDSCGDVLKCAADSSVQVNASGVSAAYQPEAPGAVNQ